MPVPSITASAAAVRLSTEFPPPLGDGDMAMFPHGDGKASDALPGRP
jgi:hypothetical protein